MLVRAEFVSVPSVSSQNTLTTVFKWLDTYIMVNAMRLTYVMFAVFEVLYVEFSFVVGTVFEVLYVDIVEFLFVVGTV